MRALNIELRERIVAEVDRKERTIREIAEIFQVSERTIYHLLRLRDEQGTLEARPHGGGAVAKITPKIQQALEAYVKEQPDITLAELQQMLRKRHRISVGVTTIWDALERAGLTVKKNSSCRRSQSEGARGVQAQAVSIASVSTLVHRRVRHPSEYDAALCTCPER